MSNFAPRQNTSKAQTSCCVHGSYGAEWEGVWNWGLPWCLLSPPWPVGWASFTRWHFCGQGLLWMLPGSLRKTWNDLCCRLVSEVLFGTRKWFPLQAMLQITKLCLQLDRDVYVFVAGYVCCVKGVSEFVFKHTGLSSVFQLRQGVPIALRATHELVGVKLAYCV